jgi:hypothetical protein
MSHGLNLSLLIVTCQGADRRGDKGSEEEKY